METMKLPVVWWALLSWAVLSPGGGNDIEYECLLSTTDDCPNYPGKLRESQLSDQALLG